MHCLYYTAGEETAAAVASAGTTECALVAYFSEFREPIWHFSTTRV